MSESLAQANHASYQGINAQLKEARECRINRGNTVKVIDYWNFIFLKRTPMNDWINFFLVIFREHFL
jgi:hypothetical protein